jgi:hypothetical protein
MGVLIGLLVLGVALWLCWRMGLPLAGSLWRAGRKANRPTPPTIYDRGRADREVSPLEMIPGTGDPMFDEIVASDPRLTKLARKTRV